MPHPKRSHPTVRLIIHPRAEHPSRSAWSLALSEPSRDLPVVRWMRTGDLYIPGPLPTEREAWEAILTLADWHGSSSRY